MPRRYGKDATEEDLLKDDSDDEDFQEHSPRANRRRPTGSKKSAKKSKKPKNRRRDDSEEEEEISEDDDDLSESIVQTDDEPEIGPNGRPVRRAVKSQPKNYAEESEEEIEDSEDDEEVVRAAGSRKKSAKGAATSGPNTRGFPIKLKIGSLAAARFESNNPPTRELPQRMTRASSRGTSVQRNTTGGKGPMKSASKAPRRGRGASETSTGSVAIGTRRSSRLGHDDEPMVALTNSGKHAEILNPQYPSEIKEEGESAVATSRENESVIADDEPEVDADAPGEVDGPDTAAEEPAGVEPEQGDAPETLPAEGEERVDDEEDDDDGPIQRTRRTKGTRAEVPKSPSPTSGPKSPEPEAAQPEEHPHRNLKRVPSQSNRQSDDDEFQLEGDASSDDAMSSQGRSPSKRREVEEDESDGNSRLRGRGKRAVSTSATRKRGRSTSDEAETQAELQDELEDLRPSPKRRNLRRREIPEMPEMYRNAGSNPRLRMRAQKPDYRLSRPELASVIDPDNEGLTLTASKKSRTQGKAIFDTHGIFGGDYGLTGLGAVGGAGAGGYNAFATGAGTAMDIDSDSSGDEITATSGPGAARGGMIGMTPTTARAPGWLPNVPQTHNVDPLQTGEGALGKVRSKQALADSDPVGVSGELSYDSIGGHDEKIDQLKEMIMLPLMYEEVFKAKNITPPRGVLFHGPPGTGKTLLARILAASTSTANRKVTFYMRKGADCLSKWVGEAERQLRLLFDEAKKNQPSIIFFDEIDGLAPVRSSKQDQIHASIVSTLLALMDGMDGRGQVVVIGATNRPDAIDPALRRPGRFDREFYFPLPDRKARRKILDINTAKWVPPLEDSFKDQLAESTKNYGGADLRKLCTEASYVAIQRQYPQIYKSKVKLKVDPSSIKVTARDFLIAMKTIVPSSERSVVSPAAPLPEHIQPLLAQKLHVLDSRMKKKLPKRKHIPPLEEAMYEEDVGGDAGFLRETMMQKFDGSRIFRPRLLIHGHEGMGQHYLGPAILHHLEGVFVQSFDLEMLTSDSTRTPEAAISQLFAEVRRHKPSVVYVPNIDIWYEILPPAAIAAFRGMMHVIPPNDPIILLATMDMPLHTAAAQKMQFVRDFFSQSKEDRYELTRPDNEARHVFFRGIIDMIRMAPEDFPPEPEERNKRDLPELPRATPEPERAPSKQELKQQKKLDHQLFLKLRNLLLHLVMMVKDKYGKRRKPAIDHDIILSLAKPRPQDDIVVSDIMPQRYELVLDEKGGLQKVIDKETNKWYYNLDVELIEDRFLGGWYTTPRSFLHDVQALKHDAEQLGDPALKRIAHEVSMTVELQMMEWDANFVQACEAAAAREKKREEEKQRKKLLKAAHPKLGDPPPARNNHRNSQDDPIIIPSSPIPRPNTSATSNGVGHGDDEHGLSAAHPHGQTPPSPPQSRDPAALSLHIPPPQPLEIEPSRDTTGRPDTLFAEPGQPASHASLNQGSLNSNSHHSSSNYETPRATTHSVRQGTQVGTQMTQTSTSGGIGVTRVDASLSHILNDASPTTSGSKRSSMGNTTGGYNSQQASNPYSQSNGTSSGRSSDIAPSTLKFQIFEQPFPGDSQLPATQIVGGGSSQDSDQASQHAAASQYGISGLVSPDARHSQAFKLPPNRNGDFVCSQGNVERVHTELAKETSGFSIEQLEQTNAAMMEAVWDHRRSANRDTVADAVLDAFHRVVADIKELQTVDPNSQSFEYNSS